MRRPVLLGMPFGLLAVMALGACKPDLVPATPPGNPDVTAFCDLAPGGGALIVTVKNQGNGNAQASTTEVDFGAGGTSQLPTPAISAGASVSLPPVTIPAGCYVSDCHFTIIVDSNDQVSESDEANNRVSGTCIG